MAELVRIDYGNHISKNRVDVTYKLSCYNPRFKIPTQVVAAALKLNTVVHIFPYKLATEFGEYDINWHMSESGTMYVTVEAIDESYAKNQNIASSVQNVYSDILNELIEFYRFYMICTEAFK